MSADWSPEARRRGLVVLLTASLLLVVLIVRPFLDALLFAAATAAVTWPIYETILRRTGGRRRLAAALTASVIVFLIGLPLTFLAIWFVQEMSVFVQDVVELAKQGSIRTELERVAAWSDALPFNDWLDQDLDLVAMVAEPLQRGVLGVGQGVARALPDAAASLATALLDAFVFVFAVLTLYADGPALLRAAARLSPLRPEYHQRLYEVFREFSTNLVIGSLTTSTLQGCVAAVGYWIAGVPNLLLATLMTTAFAFVPVVGTSLVWVPLAIWIATHKSLGWAVFLVLWNVGLTGMVDNLLRPFLLRGRSSIHPLAIFLSVVGGILWLGLPGALVGPVAVAMFLALYQIWVDQPEEGYSSPPLSLVAPSPSASSSLTAASPGVTPSSESGASGALSSSSSTA